MFRLTDGSKKFIPGRTTFLGKIFRKSHNRQNLGFWWFWSCPHPTLIFCRGDFICIPIFWELTFFFSTHLFHRRRFSSKDCFTGQFPGIGHDASHLYAGGSRMCRRKGQVQAGLLRLLRSGLEVWCSGGGAGDLSEDLTDGRGDMFGLHHLWDEFCHF